VEEIRIDSFDDLHKAINSTKGKNTIFRGVSKSEYPLIPTIGRCEPRRKMTPLSMEKRLLKLFKETALLYLTFIPRDDLEWLAVAQHHGLPTRLMDWTYNPLVATYFAIEKEYECDSAVYIFWGGATLGNEKRPEPFSIRSVKRFRPPHLSERIVAQAGLFTVHPNPSEPLEHKSLIKIIIDQTARKELKKVLYKYGVSRKHLFPGLDGLAHDLKWLETKMTEDGILRL